MKKGEEKEATKEGDGNEGQIGTIKWIYIHESGLRAKLGVEARGNAKMKVEAGEKELELHLERLPFQLTPQALSADLTLFKCRQVNCSNFSLFEFS